MIVISIILIIVIGAVVCKCLGSSKKEAQRLQLLMAKQKRATQVAVQQLASQKKTEATSRITKMTR